MDATGGILIDDAGGTITSTYKIGDVMTDLLGSISIFSGTIQFVPGIDPGTPTKTAEIEPLVVTLSDLDANIHQSMLVTVKDVTFTSTGTFATGTDYAITDPSLKEGETANFRTNFWDADYIGTNIPDAERDVTGIVSQFNGTPQITSRSLGDISMPTSNELEGLPNEFALQQNYPNPFNPSTNISFSLPQASNVKLTVYNILGQQVLQLVNSRMTAGTHTIQFNASNLASGMYMYRIEAGSFVQNKRMTLIK